MSRPVVVIPPLTPWRNPPASVVGSDAPWRRTGAGRPHGSGFARRSAGGGGRVWAALAAVVIGCFLGPLCRAAEPATETATEDADFFERKIRPVLIKRCFGCHSAKVNPPKGGLRLDSRQAVLNGGDSGPAAVPGKPAESLLLLAIAHDDSVSAMPPDTRLGEPVLADFRHWIARGLAYPQAAPHDPAGAAGHWAFQPLRVPPRPQVAHPDWPRRELDYHALARQEQAGIEPGPRAAPRALLRRVAFDLTGLPPDFETLERFAADPTQEAYEAIVDHLLAAPQFGERWARHWLDVSRYADTKGYVFQEDRNYPEAYRYRDWVIASFNEDLPYDQFVKLQLAADHFVPADDGKRLSAMGFLTLGRRFLNNPHDIIDDRIDVVGRGLMALTVSCARCHDHKFDPIPAADYYALYGIFSSSREPKNAPTSLRLVDKDQPGDAHIFQRGNPRNPGERVPRRFLSALAGEAPVPFTEGSGRRQLAEAIVAADNPLTPRVWVNRVWGHLFGQHLVRTPSDFGVRSDPPDLPGVLDSLAAQLVARGWSTKQLIREIVTSQLYQQSSAPRAEAAALDPDNRLFWRMNRKRLDFEAFRDALLAVSGLLDTGAIGGPSVQLTQVPAPRRRTLYAFIDRQNLPGLFRTFDFAGPDTHAPQRQETTVPQQGLFLMNNAFAQEMARALAARASEAGASEAGASDEEFVRRLYRFALGREPTGQQAEWTRAFLQGPAPQPPPEVVATWDYGYGTLTPAGQVEFHALPHSTGKSWQGGPKLPDDQLGWVMVTADGGHPGNDPRHMAIRRWRSPIDGRVRLRGTLRHPGAEGDGVRARVVSSRGGVLAEATARHGDAATSLEAIDVRRGDILDFVVDCRDNPNHDSFHWTVELVNLDAAGRWHSREDFRGERQPPARPLTLREQLAQVLLLSNEFAFLD